MNTEVKSGLTHLQTRNAKDCQCPPEARREAWNGFSLRASGRSKPCWHPESGLLASGLWENGFHGLKPPWFSYFVMAALGNEYNTSILYALIGFSGSQDLCPGDMINLLVIYTLFQFQETNSYFLNFGEFIQIQENMYPYLHQEVRLNSDLRRYRDRPFPLQVAQILF